MARQKEGGKALMRERWLVLGMLLAVLCLAPLPATAQSGSPAVKKPDSNGMLHALEDAFASVADRVMPSVVNVSVKSKKSTPGEGGQPPEGEQRFRDFFGPEFYDRFFKPGAYGPRHADHMATWHP